MVKVIALFRRKSGITQEEFSRYWYENHWPFALKIIPREVYAGIKKYVQNSAITLPGGGEPPFAGVLELHFDSFKSLQKWNEWYFSDAGKALQDDEKNFMDRDKMIVVIAEERVVSERDVAVP